MHSTKPFVDIHCHLLPGIDDGAKSWGDALAMAKIAADDGIASIIATPHQLGSFTHNDGDQIRSLTEQMQTHLREQGVALSVLPGADVRVEPDMVGGLQRGKVLTLADRGKHVLLELPHEVYLPLDAVLQQLDEAGLTGILSHPERNQGLLRQPDLVRSLVEAGCLMQVTAGSLMGNFGPRSQALAERMLQDNCVHFIATDAHGPMARRPLMQRAFLRVEELVGSEVAEQICCHNPAMVASGQAFRADPPRQPRPHLARWLNWRRAS